MNLLLAEGGIPVRECPINMYDVIPPKSMQTGSLEEGQGLEEGEGSGLDSDSFLCLSLFVLDKASSSLN